MIVYSLAKLTNHSAGSQNTLQDGLNSCVNLLVLLVLFHLSRFLLIKSGTGTSFGTCISFIATSMQLYLPVFLMALECGFCIIMQMPMLFTDTLKSVNTEAIGLCAIIFDAVLWKFDTPFLYALYTLADSYISNLLMYAVRDIYYNFTIIIIHWQPVNQ